MNRQILIVDDELGPRQLLRIAFERLSWHVTTCDSGPEAMEIYGRQRFDLVMLDVFMEPIDGIEVLRQIRKSRPRALVMMMTGLGTIELAVEAMKKGADEFVTKPFKLKELTERVDELVEQYMPRSHPLVRQLDRFVEEHSSRPDMNLQVLSCEFHVSERYVCRLFRDSLKTTFRARLRRHRLERAKKLLTSTKLPVHQVAAMCGFTHQKRLSEAFMRDEQMTPRRFRQVGAPDG